MTYTRVVNMRKPCLLLVLTACGAIMTCANAFGAGGTCPSGANYLNPANPAGPQVTLSSLGVTSCYYISASGSDSNNGTGESTPWLHAPGMPTCTSTCKSTTPASGNGFIFRGGDAWHFGNSGASPYTGGTWNWTWQGSSSNAIYVGVDMAWYSGSSWARPILTDDNPTSTSTVGSCTHTIGGFVSINPAGYMHFDNFELTGLCWNSGPGGPNYIYWQSPNQNSNTPPFYIENNYVHGWTHTTYSTNCSDSLPCAVATVAFGGPGNYGGVVLQFNVLDGSDSDDTGVSATGSGAGDAYIVQYNVFRHYGGGTVANNCHIVHDNLFEYLNNGNNLSTVHTDGWACYGEANDSTHGGDGTPNLFYNNVTRYVGTEYSAPLSFTWWIYPSRSGANADMMFNNIFYEIYANPNNYITVCYGSPCGDLDLWNNTLSAEVQDYQSDIFGIPTSGNVVKSVNNHWITNAGSTPSAVFSSTSTVTESTPVYQTLSAANAQGYTVSNGFEPTSSSGSTVTTSGTNETSAFCSGLSNTVAQSYCVQGTSAGCSYNTTNHTVTCPSRTPAARPASGGWNVGAYQFSSGGAPAAPTNLVATAN